MLADERAIDSASKRGAVTRTAVVALGGNALIAEGQQGTYDEQRSNAISKELAPDTVVWGVVEFSGSWVATDVAQSIASRIVTQILARVGTSMAVEGLSAGGATVGGTTAGAGAGSLAGPVGTIIGLGAGLVVGAAVDWWLSDQFEAKVTNQCNNFLNGLEHRLRDGGQQNPGLRQTLNEAARVAGQSQRKAIENAISESQKS